MENEIGRESLRESAPGAEALLAMAAHELRTPAAALHLAMQALLELLRAADEPGGPRWTAMMDSLLRASDRQASRLVELLDGTLDAGALAARAEELHREPMDLVAVVKDVIARLQTGETVQLDSPQSLRGRWDRSRLDQVFTNLIANAIKYGRHQPIEVRVGIDGGDAVVAVEDHGIGIPSDRVTRLFRPFGRADDGHPGFGLGLYIAERLVSAHEGRLSVSSAVGRGSVFSVRLPGREAS